MNEHYLLDEFQKGLEIYPLIPMIDTVAAIQFFLRHGHQIAYDDGDYDLFIQAFPNFFDYVEHEGAFLERFVK